MKKCSLICMLAVLFGSIFSASAETAIYEFKPVQECFIKAFYKRNASLGEYDNSTCLILSGHAQWVIKLNPADFANRTIFLNYEYKTANIVAANKNQGFKVTFIYAKNGKKIYCHRPPVSGNKEWSTMQQKIRVPDGITEVTFSVAIPNGNAWVRKLYISGQPTVKPVASGKPASHNQNLIMLKKKTGN